METNNAKHGSEPVKQTYGNTREKPDNIKPSEDGQSTDNIVRGADASNLQANPQTQTSNH